MCKQNDKTMNTKNFQAVFSIERDLPDTLSIIIQELLTDGFTIALEKYFEKINIYVLEDQVKEAKEKLDSLGI